MLPLRIAAAARPSAVIPRSGYKVVPVLLVVGFQQRVGLLRPVEIFLIPPAGNVQVGRRGLAQERIVGLCPPELIAIGMVHEVVPGGNLLAEVLGDDVGERPQFEIPIVSVQAVKLEIGVGFLGLSPAALRTRNRN